MSERWEKLSGLLDRLFDLEADVREQELQRIATEDPALAGELRRVLRADERSGLLDAGIGNAAPTLVAHLASSEDAERQRRDTGKRVGQYRLLERIGSGGMGDVWRGERVGDFEQQVAIKLIRPLLDSPALRERFARERRILARLDHPNIARLLDGGVSDEGTPWFAMEFVRGEPVTRHADTQRLDVRARVELVLQVCNAVAHAQALLVVHRDLKPSNILVDGQGRVRVLDFGIARLLDDSADANLTATGVRVYSPAYAAPEQIRGDTIGTAVDVFALGAVLFELLTGEVPHPKRGAAPERLLAGLEGESAPRPGQILRERTATGGRSLSTLRGVSADLDTIVATALQPDPARRYAGAAQLADDLRRWLDGRTIAAQPDTASYRLRKFVARHRIAVGSATAVLLALLAGFGLALWQAGVARGLAQQAATEARRANEQSARAEHEAAQARAQAARVKHVKEFFVSAFLQADPMRRTAEGPLTLDEAFEATLDRARTELAGDPVLQADVLDDFGEILANKSRLEEAQQLFEQALAVAEKEYGPVHPAVAESLVNLAVVRGLRGHPSMGRPEIERAVEILEADDGGDPLALANALGMVASVRQQMGDRAGMRTAVERSLEIFRAHAPDSPGLMVPLANLAMLDIGDDRLDEGEALLQEAIALVEKQYGPDSPNLWPNLTTLADLHYRRGDLQERSRVSARALQIAQAGFDGDHRWKAASLIEVGENSARAGKVEQGLSMMREGISMFERLQHPGLGAALRRLAIMQRAQNDDAGAMQSLQRAWDLCRSRDQTREQTCRVIRANRALMLARLGDGAQALAEADASLAALADSPTLFSERGQAMEARAAALSALDRRDEARRQQDEAIALLRANFGDAHPETQRVIQARDAL